MKAEGGVGARKFVLGQKKSSRQAAPTEARWEGSIRLLHWVSKSKGKTEAKAKAKAKAKSKRGGAIGPAKTARAKAGAGATRAARTH